MTLLYFSRQPVTRIAEPRIGGGEDFTVERQLVKMTQAYPPAAMGTDDGLVVKRGVVAVIVAAGRRMRSGAGVESVERRQHHGFWPVAESVADLYLRPVPGVIAVVRVDDLVVEE